VAQVADTEQEGQVEQLPRSFIQPSRRPYAVELNTVDTTRCN
jgi:hypothetical protein